MSRQTLSADQRQELEDVVKTTREVKLYRRAKVILYKEAGYSAEEIEVHTGVSPSWGRGASAGKDYQIVGSPTPIGDEADD